ncbi:MAG: hypothetical protein AAFP19_17135 [Bacteroidota bacterium]
MTNLKYLLILLLLSPLFCLAQKTTVDRPDELIEPKPYQEAYFRDANDYSMMKSLTTLSKAKYQDFKRDTLSKQYFDERGRLIKKIRYRNNSPNKTTIYQYTPKGDLQSWQIFEERFSTLTQYTYTPNHNIEQTQQWRINNKPAQNDSTLITTKSFTYDQDQLIQIIHNQSSIEEYSYEGKLLHFKKGPYISKSFAYDEEEKLTQLYEYMGNKIDSTKRKGSKIYYYDPNNRLILDSILNHTTKVYQITEYSYQKDGLLKSVKVRYGESYRNINFEYIDKKINRVRIETNQSNNAYLHHWIDHRIANTYPFPIKYKEEFDYDQYGNRISKKVFVNDELYSEVNYQIIYRQ